MLRDVDGLSTAEVADSLKLSRVAVKVRLHRARSLLRSQLLTRAGSGIAGSFRFLGNRCDRMVGAVMHGIRAADFAVSPDGGSARAGEEFPQ